MADKEPQSIEVEKLSPHPKNPRLLVREDVVESILRQIKEDGVVRPEHALLVRPINGGFEIVSGHHRAEAARRGKLKKIPCWVRDLNDDDAFMQLVLSNAQGELTPLEIGVHALNAVPLAKPGPAKKGEVKPRGLSEYAERIGKTKQYVSQLYDAAEVFEAVRSSTQVDDLLDRAKHLAAIHRADARAWRPCVEFMLKEGWSVEDANHWIDEVKEFSIPEKWIDWCPYEAVVYRYLEGKEFSRKTLARLFALAEATITMIEEFEDEEGEKALKDYRAWLVQASGKASWDPRKLEQKHQEIQAALADKKNQREAAWLFGAWQEHLPSLKDGSVNLLLTDPPYGADFQSDFKLDRREKRRFQKIEGDLKEGEAARQLEALGKAIMPKLAQDAHLLVFCRWSVEAEFMEALESCGYKIRGSIVWVKNNTGMGDPTTTFAPKHERIIHAVKGSPSLFVREPDVMEADRVKSERHPTEKPVDLLERLILATTVKQQLVADPFGGVASSMVAAKKCDRLYWGCEVDADYYKAGMERLKKA